jgi:kinesin family protein 18/19
MIANVGPCEMNYEDTSNTLKYANRTKDLKTTLKQNPSIPTITLNQ